MKDKISGNEPAMPTPPATYSKERKDELARQGYGDMADFGFIYGESGLSKREYFAALNCAAILSRYYELPPDTKVKQLQDWIDKYGESVVIQDAIANDAINASDALINAINNPLPVINK